MIFKQRLLPIFTLILSITSPLFSGDGYMPHSTYTLYNHERHPSAALSQLLTTLEVKHDGSWKSIVDATQKAWLRKPGTERWHLEEIITNKKEIITELLTTLGCIKQVDPTHTQYDYVVLLGATVHRVRSRLAFILELWNKGIRFNTVVLLGSERPLDPTLESEAHLHTSSCKQLPFNTAWQPSTLPKTEYEMINMVCDQTAFPPNFAPIKKVFINTPMQLQPDGTQRRANTLDTIYDWLSTKPHPGTCLFVSNQPYVGYQDAAVRTAMPATFPLETVGEAASDHEKIAVYLDTMARWIYQERQRNRAH